MRQLLNSSRAAVLVVLALFVVAGVVAGKHLLQPAGARPASGMAFYTVDDGKTFFREAASQDSPFQKDGKPAYRVAVWKCATCGTDFVCYLERFKEKKVNAGSAPSGAVAMGNGRDVDVKAPGAPETTWVKLTTEEGIKLTSPKCPKGHTDCEPAVP